MYIPELLSLMFRYTELVHNKNGRMSECVVQVMYQINALLARFFFFWVGGLMNFISLLVQRLIFDRNKTKSTSTENLPVKRRSAPSVAFKLYIPCIVN